MSVTTTLRGLVVLLVFACVATAPSNRKEIAHNNDAIESAEGHLTELVLVVCVCVVLLLCAKNDDSEAEAYLQMATNDYFKKQARPPEVLRESLDIKSRCGEGRFGDVLEGTVTGLGGTYLRKCTIVIVRASAPQKEKQAFKKFVDECCWLSNRNVVKMLATCIDGDPPGVVSEYTKTDLKSFLSESGPTAHATAKISIGEQVEFLLEIARGVDYLHTVNYAHDDLAARNILIAPDDRVLISTLSAQRTSHPLDYYDWPEKGEKLPIRWMAPEALTDDVSNTETMIWMFGVVSWEVFAFGDLPWGGVKNEDIVSKVRKGNTLDRPNGCPESLYQVMIGCWDLEPEERPSTGRLLEILSEIDANSSHKLYINLEGPPTEATSSGENSSKQPTSKGPEEQQQGEDSGPPPLQKAESETVPSAVSDGSPNLPQGYKELTTADEAGADKPQGYKELTTADEAGADKPQGYKEVTSEVGAVLNDAVVPAKESTKKDNSGNGPTGIPPSLASRMTGALASTGEFEDHGRSDYVKTDESLFAMAGEGTNDGTAPAAVTDKPEPPAPSSDDLTETQKESLQSIPRRNSVSLKPKKDGPRVPWHVAIDDYMPEELQDSTSVETFDDVHDLLSTKWNQVDEQEVVDRTSALGQFKTDDLNRPLNPTGRHGKRGRGELPRYGPNHLACALLTRWRREEGEMVVNTQDGTPTLEFLAVRKEGTSTWTLPSILAGSGSSTVPIFNAVLDDCVYSDHSLDEEDIETLDAKAEIIKTNGMYLYGGYLEDERNTDNAWVEITCNSYHDEAGELFDKMKLSSVLQHDVKYNVAWLDTINTSGRNLEKHTFDAKLKNCLTLISDDLLSIKRAQLAPSDDYEHPVDLSVLPPAAEGAKPPAQDATAIQPPPPEDDGYHKLNYPVRNEYERLSDGKVVEDDPYKTLSDNKAVDPEARSTPSETKRDEPVDDGEGYVEDNYNPPVEEAVITGSYENPILIASIATAEGKALEEVTLTENKELDKPPALPPKDVSAAGNDDMEQTNYINDDAISDQMKKIQLMQGALPNSHPRQEGKKPINNGTATRGGDSSATSQHPPDSGKQRRGPRGPSGGRGRGGGHPQHQQQPQYGYGGPPYGGYGPPGHYDPYGYSGGQMYPQGPQNPAMMQQYYAWQQQQWGYGPPPLQGPGGPYGGAYPAPWGQGGYYDAQGFYYPQGPPGGMGRGPVDGTQSARAKQERLRQRQQQIRQQEQQFGGRRPPQAAEQQARPPNGQLRAGGARPGGARPSPYEQNVMTRRKPTKPNKYVAADEIVTLPRNGENIRAAVWANADDNTTVPSPTSNKTTRPAATRDCWCDPNTGRVCAIHESSRSSRQSNQPNQQPPASSVVLDASDDEDDLDGVQLYTELRRKILIKGTEGYGFVIRGDAPVAIISVEPGGAAEDAGLSVGDVFVRLKTHDVWNKSQNEVVAMLRAAGDNPLDLIVKQLTTEQLEEARKLIAGGQDLTRSRRGSNVLNLNDDDDDDHGNSLEV